MLDLLAWTLSTNDIADLREHLEQANKRLSRLPMEERLAALQAENQDLKIRLGIVIRILAEKGLIEPKEIVSAFNRFKAPHK